MPTAPRPSRARQRGAAHAAVLPVLAACSGGQQQPGDDSPYNGTPIDGAFELPDATFTDTDGADYHLRDDSAGRTTAVFFGFTNCPDICPTTMADLAVATADLTPEERDAFSVVFVTADPERDDPDLLRTWLDSFDPSFTGLSGDLDTTDSAAADLGVSVDRPEDRSGDYQVGHGSQTLVFGPDGTSRLMWSYGTEPDAIAGDLRLLLAEEAE
jgi:protein SCO1/2